MHLAKEPRTFGNLVSDGFAGFGPLFFKILPIIVLLFISLIVVGGLGVGMGFYVGGMTGMILGAVFFILLYFIIAYFYTAQLIRTYGVLIEDHGIIVQTWRLAKDRFLFMVGAMLIISIIFAAIMMLFQLLVTMLLVNQNYGIAIAVGIMGWLISIYLMVQLMMALPLVAIRNLGVFASIGHSFCLVKGHWWRSFGLLFVVVGIPHIIFFAVLLIIQSFLPVGVLMYTLSAIIGLLEYLVVAVLMLSAIVVLLNDLEWRKVPITAPVPPTAI